MSAPILDDEDKSTAIALLTRLVRVQEERNHVNDLKKQVDEKWTVLNLQWTRCRDGFGIFGFDYNSKELWEEIKSAIGMDGWNAAFARARENPLPRSFPDLTPPPPPISNPPIPPQQDETEETVDGVDESSQSVREFVLDALEKSAEVGIKAAEIRAAYEAARDAKLHDKTIGMTLYRLSKDNLARRDGRTWFFVPPKEETKNPGVGAPGSETVFD